MKKIILAVLLAAFAVAPLARAEAGKTCPDKDKTTCPEKGGDKGTCPKSGGEKGTCPKSGDKKA
jgi:hypothetical protein